jgi:chromosome segregation ATPase
MSDEQLTAVIQSFETQVKVCADLAVLNSERLVRLETDMHQRFADLTGELRFFAKSVHEKFDKIDEKFEQIDTRFDQVDARFDRLETRVDGVETKVAGLETRLNEFAENTDQRLGCIEGHLNGKVARTVRMPPRAARTTTGKRQKKL